MTEATLPKEIRFDAPYQDWSVHVIPPRPDREHSTKGVRFSIRLGGEKIVYRGVLLDGRPVFDSKSDEAPPMPAAIVNACWNLAQGRPMAPKALPSTTQKEEADASKS